MTTREGAEHGFCTRCGAQAKRNDRMWWHVYWSCSGKKPTYGRKEWGGTPTAEFAPGYANPVALGRLSE